MIQRIQSIFLALGAFSSFGLFATDAAETEAPVNGSELFSDAHYNLLDSPILIGGAAGAGLLLLVAIFLFRNRPLQAILSNVALILALAYTAYGAFAWYTDSAATQAYADLGVALPFLTMIFAVLAGRYIRSDEKLVRSADRLR